MQSFTKWQIRIIQINVMLKHRFVGGLLQHNALIGSYLMFLMLYCNLIPFLKWKSSIPIQSRFVCSSAVHIPVRLSILRNYLYACLVEQLGGQFRVEGRRHGKNGQILGGKLIEDGRTGSRHLLTLVLIPLCWRLMWLCSELRDLATVPQSTQR